MPTQFQAFRKNKEILHEERKKEYSERTLKYFGMISEMLEREADYGSSFPFLESVYNYIEEKEFITENQIAIIDRIQSHPESGYGEYADESPF